MQAWIAAAGGGIVGAIAMAMWAMMIALLSGMGIWTPVQLIAATWFGPAAMMHATVGVIMVGLITHMMMGAVLGVIFVMVLGMLRISAGPARLAWGVLFGLIVWVVNQFVLLPIVDPMMASHMAPWAFAMGHAVFGLVLAAFVLRTRQTI